MSGSIDHVLLDIEGTTCPVSFVAEVLFPYARLQLPRFLQEAEATPRLRALQQELLACWRQEREAEACALLQEQAQRHGVTPGEGELPPAALLPYLHWLDRCDRKLTAWKDLQGLIWEEGYHRGEIQAELYPEAADTLRAWHAQGLILSVYSSGSVTAQKLLYGHTSEGDLRPLFRHWFDTRIGSKQDPQSYRHILEQLHSSAQRVLFVSDALQELEAAAAAGMRCCFSDRPGNPQRHPGRFRSVGGLAEIRPQQL